jgi:hypothetical protein
MRRFTLLCLALLTALGGCANPHSQGVVAAYRPGQKPTSTPIRYAATVELYARDQPQSTGPLTSTAVTGGTAVGFRAEPNGSVVAVVGERPIPIPDGRCEWVIVPGSGPTWWGRRKADGKQAATSVGTALGMTAVVLGALGLGAAYAMASAPH